MHTAGPSVAFRSRVLKLRAEVALRRRTEARRGCTAYAASVATIKNPQLAIATDRAHDEATVTVVCDVEFTEFEVNAMNLLGLRYSLHCELLDMDMLYERAEVPFRELQFPVIGRAATMHERVELEAQAAMHVLHRFIFGKDSLVAELTLRNDETGDPSMRRSDVVRVDLAA
jgi:hypothetical protein